MVLRRGRSKTRQGMRTLTLIVLPIVMAAGGENFPGERCYAILAGWGRKRKKLLAGNRIVSPSYNVYRFINDEHFPRYFDFLVRSRPFISVVVCYSKGVWTSRLRLYPEEFFSIRLPLPPEREQRAIVHMIETETGHHNMVISKLRDSINLLQEYRSSLITAVVSGQIDISKMKAQAPE